MSRTLLSFVLVIACVASSSAQVTFDPVEGIYHVEYVGFGDSVHVTALLPGNRARPWVSATIVPASVVGFFRYDYELGNHANALAGLGTFRLPATSVDSSRVPSVATWEFVYVSTEAAGTALWVQNSHTDYDIAAGDSLGGFIVVSSGLPAIVTATGAALHKISYDDEGPTGAIRREVDSLFQVTAHVMVATVAPRDPPTPFDLGDFLDTLGTYPLRAADQGWIGDSTSAELDRLLNDASSALSGGDSTWTATLLGTVLNHVEAVKDDSLSSEGYALMKHNIEHALSYLPPLVPVKMFLQGPYSSGVMSPKNDDTPTMQPFCNPSLPFNYDGSESVTKFPSFVADWIHVMLIETSGGWTVQHARPALLSKTGFAFPAFPSSVNGDYRLAVAEYNHVAVASDTLVTILEGSAGHDFTLGADYSEGRWPQKPLGGGFYGLWAADGNQDGMVTAPDFNIWNAATTAGATGYHAADYNRDQIVTAPDFNLWNANTTAGAMNPPSLNSAIHAIPEICSGAMPLSMTLPTSFVRLTVVRDDGQDFWLNVEVRSDTTLSPNNTFGSATVDVSYDDTILTFIASDPGVLRAQNGYTVDALDLGGAEQQLVRLIVQSSEIGKEPGSRSGYDIGSDWEVIRTLRFSQTTSGDRGVSVDSRSVSLGFYDSPTNENGTDTIIESVVEIQ